MFLTVFMRHNKYFSSVLLLPTSSRSPKIYTCSSYHFYFQFSKPFVIQFSELETLLYQIYSFEVYRIVSLDIFYSLSTKIVQGIFQRLTLISIRTLETIEEIISMIESLNEKITKYLIKII